MTPLPLEPEVDVEMCDDHYAVPVPVACCMYCLGRQPATQRHNEHGPFERLLEPTKPVKGIGFMWNPLDDVGKVPVTAGLVHIAGANWVDDQIWALLEHCPDLHMLELVVSLKHRAVTWIPYLARRGVGIQVCNRFKGGL